MNPARKCKRCGGQVFGFMIMGLCLDCHIVEKGEKIGYAHALFALKDEDKARARVKKALNLD